jgi:urease accessory protein
VLAIERTASGHAIAELRRGERLAPRILERGAVVRAAFVPTQAGPLAGDRDSARIVVGAGAVLALEPVAATLALPGEARTVLRLDVTVHAGGRLVLDEGPLIVAAGAHCVIELEHGAVAAVRETLVLGRDGEAPGALDSQTRVVLAGTALLHDGLRFDKGADAHVALAPGHRVICTASLLGMRPAEAGAGIATPLQLHGPGALLRATGPATSATDAAIEPSWRVWSRAVLSG